MKKDIGIERYLIKHYSKTLIKNPHSFIFLPLANSFKKRGNPEAAIEICQNGLKSHPNYISGRALLGELYFHCKRYSEAERELKTVTDSDPKHITARKLLIDIYLKNGSVDEASEMEKEIVTICAKVKSKRYLRKDIKKHVDSYHKRTEETQMESATLFPPTDTSFDKNREEDGATEIIIDDKLALKEIGSLFTSKRNNPQVIDRQPKNIKQLSIFESMLSKIEEDKDDS